MEATIQRFNEGHSGELGMSRYTGEQCAIAGREAHSPRERVFFFRSLPRFHKCYLRREMMDAGNEVSEKKMLRSMVAPVIFGYWRGEKKREEQKFADLILSREKLLLGCLRTKSEKTEALERMVNASRPHIRKR